MLCCLRGEMWLLILIHGWFGQAAALEGNSNPRNDPPQFEVWPNQTSRANSDPWLAEHHDQIKLMRPRLLLVNFSQEAKPETLEKLTRGIIAGLAEGSRYHGYKNSNAPVFLDYQIFKFVDLRESGKIKGNS